MSLPAPPDHELVEHCSALHQKIAQGKQDIETAVWRWAGDLHQFNEQRGWEVLGMESQMEWLASPEIELQKAQFSMLCKLYRKLVVERGITVEQLEGVSPSKVDRALPALESGERDVDEVVAACRTLTRKDVIREFGSESDQSDVERKACPTCGSKVPAERLEEAA